MKKIGLTIAVALISIAAFAQRVNWKKVAVLVYTKNGKGYVHTNIPDAVACIVKLGGQYGFKVDTASDPSVMTDANLKKYRLLIFPSTNNDVFDTDAQRLAFRHYIEAGGGFVGIHAVSGTERNWQWFKMMVGGTFAWHPKFQPLKLKVLDPHHASMAGLPREWTHADECYFVKEQYPGPTTLMAYELSSLNTTDTAQAALIQKHRGWYGDLYPAVWSYDFDGGHTWCTLLGHDAKDYTEPVYVQHIWQGIRYVAGRVGVLDYKSAYAAKYDDPVEF